MDALLRLGGYFWLLLALPFTFRLDAFSLFQGKKEINNGTRISFEEKLNKFRFPKEPVSFLNLWECTHSAA
jgi:hypothetical protein